MTYEIVKNSWRSEYSFTVPEDVVAKEVHWYLMSTDSYYSKPQREEYFADSGFYKYHEAYHLLKFANEKQILEKAYAEYQERKRNNRVRWTPRFLGTRLPILPSSGWFPSRE